MRRDEIIGKLKERAADLRAHGVLHAALFGSVARDQQRDDSDIDILVDLDPRVVVTMFDYAGVKDYVASLFNGAVDVIDRGSKAAPSSPGGGRCDPCFLTPSATRWKTSATISPAPLRGGTPRTRSQKEEAWRLSPICYPVDVFAGTASMTVTIKLSRKRQHLSPLRRRKASICRGLWERLLETQLPRSRRPCAPLNVRQAARALTPDLPMRSPLSDRLCGRASADARG